jgi:hypothetical protein
MAVKVGARVVARWLAAVSLLVGACAPARADRFVEPVAAAAFLAAHAQADAPRVAASVSPLYWAELRRRGRGAPALNPLWLESVRVLDFAYTGGIVDEGGFVHVLYAARPKKDPDGPTSVWRVDLDPAGRVIWGEPIRLLPDGGEPATPGARSDAARRLVGAASGDDRLSAGGLLGVRSSSGDGYYALGLHRDGAVRPATVVFFAVDAAGARVPDYWSFGREVPIPTGPNSSRLSEPFRIERSGLAAEDRELLRQYLRTIP